MSIKKQETTPAHVRQRADRVEIEKDWRPDARRGSKYSGMRDKV